MPTYSGSWPPTGSAAHFPPGSAMWQYLMYQATENWTVDEHACWEREPRRGSINQVHAMDGRLGNGYYTTIQGRVIGPALLHELETVEAGELCDTRGCVLGAWSGPVHLSLSNNPSFFPVHVPAGETYGVTCFAYLTYEVINVPTLDFGKHAGKDFKDVPVDYLDWLKREAETRLKQVNDELGRRAALEAPASPLIDQIVQAGYRALAKAAHPDTGGNATAFLDLQAAKTQLDAVLSEIHAATAAPKAGRPTPTRTR